MSENKWMKRSSEWVVLLLLLVLCLLLIVMLLVMLLRGGWVACHLLYLGWIEQFVSPLAALSPPFSASALIMRRFNVPPEQQQQQRRLKLVAHLTRTSPPSGWMGGGVSEKSELSSTKYPGCRSGWVVTPTHRTSSTGRGG